MFIERAVDLAEFKPEKMAKATLVKGEQLFAGLNTFEPGQEHALHTHEGQEKLYVVLRGQGIIRIGEQSEMLPAGGMAFAASGVEHSIRNPGPERLVVMVILSPPPH